jgi:hypothetical protein
MTLVITADFKGFPDLLPTYEETTRGSGLALILLTIVSSFPIPPFPELMPISAIKLSKNWKAIMMRLVSAAAFDQKLTRLIWL